MRGITSYVYCSIRHSLLLSSYIVVFAFLPLIYTCSQIFRIEGSTSSAREFINFSSCNRSALCGGLSGNSKPQICCNSHHIDNISHIWICGNSSSTLSLNFQITWLIIFKILWIKSVFVSQSFIVSSSFSSEGSKPQICYNPRHIFNILITGTSENSSCTLSANLQIFWFIRNEILFIRVSIFSLNNSCF